MIPTRGQIKSRFLRLVDDPKGSVFLIGDGPLLYPGALTNIVVSGGTGTATTVQIHGLSVGTQVNVINSLTYSLNGTATITAVPSGTTFAFNSTAPSGTYADATISVGSTPFDHGFQEAYDALFNAFLNAQCPRIEIIVSYHLTSGTTSFTPAQAGLMDFASIKELEERTWGATADKFIRIDQVNKLSQQLPASALREFTWRFDTFWFIGATTDREVRITYESSGIAPVNDSDSINVDGCLTFMAKYAAAIMAPLKGLDEIGARYMQEATGPSYDGGRIGGELFRIIQPRVRELQNVQVAQRPFSAQSRRLIRRGPYIAAQAPASGGIGVPAQFTTFDGTITPACDGTTTAFFLAYPVVTAEVYLNGNRLTSGKDYSFGANVVTFTLPPFPTDTITVSGWI